MSTWPRRTPPTSTTSFPAFWENSRYDGKIWAIPFQRSTPVLYWNKEAFAEVGLDPDRPPRTWDELAEYAALLTKREGGQVTRWGVTISGGWNDWLFEGFVRQNGGKLIDFENRSLHLNSPEAVEALEFWVKLTQQMQVAPPHSTWASTPADFVAGKTAMLYHSTGILTFLKDSATFDFGVAFMPGKKSYGAAVGGGNFFIFKNIPKERQDAAWTFIRWMTTAERAAQWSIASGYIATRQSSYEYPQMQGLRRTASRVPGGPRSAAVRLRQGHESSVPAGAGSAQAGLGRCHRRPHDPAAGPGRCPTPTGDAVAPVAARELTEQRAGREHPPVVQT